MEDKKTTVAIIGAGMAGILWAKKLKAAGYSIVIFEKSAHLGGVWDQIANAYSQVQIAECDYRLEPYNNDSDKQKSYPTREQVLQHLHKIAEKYQLYQDLKLNTEVIKVSQIAETCYQITFNENHQMTSMMVNGVIVLTGLLQTKKMIGYPGEEHFLGKISYGLQNDLCAYDFRGKSVIIQGMGSFAIENARQALLNGAEKVTLVCRSINLVFSAYFHYLTTRSPIYKGQSALKILKLPYKHIQRLDLLEKLTNSTITDQHVVSPVSDFFFIALYYKKLEIIKGEITKLDKNTVQMNESLKIPADLIVKNIGFDQEKTNIALEQLIGHSLFNGLFLNQQNSFVYCREPNLNQVDVGKTGFFTLSYLYSQELTSDLFIYYFKNPQKFRKIITQFPQFPVREFDLHKSEIFLKTIWQHDREGKRIIKAWLANKLIRSHQRYPYQHFIQENQKNWYTLCATLGKNQPPLKYPFKSKLSWLKRTLEKIKMAYLLF
ncbi:MAG: NAD(P)/FAD-dependent oxidoreductase [Legionellales bacterium]|nr:NAD(P)/FAD-dependent oxidoreductase [Legionellales bacterium]